ncbi:SCO2524 family protein [Dactylosporangium sp. NBC_01737]|uniref:SCO2524 family protein n=1 Tax=Dactylosporangium sp. NBC_01737 TaxID=2975959 RepID=UPI002E0E6A42|nr:SCO2524 family protein [Dactylosporangium sp. NBC_01737]
MLLNPRAELLGVWRAVSRYAFRDGGFLWGDPAAGDALNDAQQLLCILGPATNLPPLRLDVPDATADDAVAALGALGDRAEIPARLVVAMREYLTRYTDGTGAPVFPGGPALSPPAPALDVVAAAGTDLRLCLAIIGFCKVYRQRTDDVERLASIRLTAAMAALLRAFAIRASTDEAHLRHLVRPGPRDERAVHDEYRAGLVEVRAALRDIRIGTVPDHDAADRAAWFECGWAWTAVADALPIDLFAEFGDDVVIPQRPGPAVAPQLYSSLLALEAVAELFSERTRVLGLLTEEQQRLSRALQLRYDVTVAYFTSTATFGEHRWPLERIPWRTADGDESTHNSAVVAAITGIGLARARNPQVPYAYLLRVLTVLAARHGIARPPLAAATPSVLPEHHCPCPPGATMPAAGAVPILFRTAVRTATAIDDAALRTGFEDLADLLWQHLPLFPAEHDPNWHDTAHTVDGLTLAMQLTADGRRPPPPMAFVHDLLTAAETLAAEDDPRLQRARTLVDAEPARAAALLYRLIADLDTPA